MSKLSRCALVSCLLLIAAGCRAPTDITLDVTTDEACPGIRTHGGTRIRVGAQGDPPGGGKAATTDTCDGTEIGTLLLVPSGAASTRIAIEVTTGIGRAPETCGAAGDGGVADFTGCIVARRVLSFLPHTPLRLPIAKFPVRLDVSVCVHLPIKPAVNCIWRYRAARFALM